MAARRRALAPEVTFTCTKYACTMPAKVCIARQAARWPGGNRWKSGAVRAKRAPIHDWCGSGRCDQGKSIAKLCAFRPEDEWSKGRFRFFKDDVPLQRARMKQLDAEDPRLLGDRPPPEPDIYKLLDDLRVPDEPLQLESSTY